METIFDQPGSIAINKARMEHLASLGLDLEGKSVLEVGSGVGELTSFFEEHRCRIIATDARATNVAENLRRHPHRKVEVADLTVPGSHDTYGRFDVVFCYGTLYHLPDPALTIRDLSAVCSGIMLLETCVNRADNGEINPKQEPASALDQSFRGMGCRPARNWVFQELLKYFSHVYVTKTQPDHAQFPLQWPVGNPEQNCRSVFVASRTALKSDLLLPFLPLKQTTAEQGVAPLALSYVCDSLEQFLPVTTQKILGEFDLLAGHPWAQHAASPVTSYYACLHALAALVRPSKILEIGTAFGMSGASLVRACDPLELFISVDLGFFHKEYNFPESNLSFAERKVRDWCRQQEISPERVRYFQANSQPDGKSDNENKVKGVPHWSEVPELVSLLKPESFDVLFVDGKHTEDGLYNDMMTFWSYLRPGGLLLCDDLHDPAIYKGIFPWAGETLESFHRFVTEYQADIEEWYIWDFPHVLPPTFEGLRPFGIIRKKELSPFKGVPHDRTDQLQDVFASWITTIAHRDRRLYYRDQTTRSLNQLVQYVRQYRPTRVVELGTLLGLSLRTWLAADPDLRVTAVDLSFDNLHNSCEFLPLDLSRVVLLQQNILDLDFSGLWSASDRVILYVDAHDLSGVPIMEHVLCHALPVLPAGSLVIVDDLWYSPQELTEENAGEFLNSVVINEIDPLQCFDGYFAPYWQGGSFMGFMEVVPLMEWANRNKVELSFSPGIKSVMFEWRP